MPISIGVGLWSNISEEVLLAIKQQASLKATYPIDWDGWLKITRDEVRRFGIPYSEGHVVTDLIETYCGIRDWHYIYFVPYRFNFELCEDFPPPVEFWFDNVQPAGWNSEFITIIDGAWFHTVWPGTSDDEYRARAYELAERFNQGVELALQNRDSIQYDDYYCARRYVEVGLIEYLDFAIPRNLPVTIYH